jgi:hypothetical protein
MRNKFPDRVHDPGSPLGRAFTDTYSALDEQSAKDEQFGPFHRLSGPIIDYVELAIPLRQSCRLLPALIQDHATEPDILLCHLSWLRNAAPDLLPQDALRIALTVRAFLKPQVSHILQTVSNPP